METRHCLIESRHRWEVSAIFFRCGDGVELVAAERDPCGTGVDHPPDDVNRLELLWSAVAASSCRPTPTRARRRVREARWPSAAAPIHRLTFDAVCFELGQLIVRSQHEYPTSAFGTVNQCS